MALALNQKKKPKMPNQNRPLLLCVVGISGCGKSSKVSNILSDSTGNVVAFSNNWPGKSHKVVRPGVDIRQNERLLYRNFMMSKNKTFVVDDLPQWTQGVHQSKGLIYAMMSEYRVRNIDLIWVVHAFDQLPRFLLDHTPRFLIFETGQKPSDKFTARLSYGQRLLDTIEFVNYRAKLDAHFCAVVEP